MIDQTTYRDLTLGDLWLPGDEREAAKQAATARQGETNGPT